MANQFGPHFDQLERQRRIARQIIPADPLAAHRLTLEKAMFVDPIPHLQEFLAKITGADRIAEIRRALVPAPPDLFGPQRRAIEQLTRRHTDAYDQVIGRLTGARDPFATQRPATELLLADNLLGRYEQIVGNFNALVGGVIPTMSLAADPAIAEAPAEGPPLSLPSHAMVIHLLAIAWLCFCLIAYGVGPALLGDVILEALALAGYLSDSE